MQGSSPELAAVIGLVALPFLGVAGAYLLERRVLSVEDTWGLWIGLNAILVPAWLGLVLGGLWGLAAGAVVSGLLVRAMLRTRSARGGRARRP